VGAQRRVRTKPAWAGGVAATCERQTGELPETLSGCEAVSNLSGEPILGGRWTLQRRHVITASRLATTAQIVAAIEQAFSRPRVLISVRRATAENVARPSNRLFSTRGRVTSALADADRGMAPE
jgi:NAD dependent epimerase/dehydratase family enzyme